MKINPTCAAAGMHDKIHFIMLKMLKKKKNTNLWNEFKFVVANSGELWFFLHIFGDVISRIPRFSVSVRKLTLLKFVFIKDEGYP